MTGPAVLTLSAPSVPASARDIAAARIGEPSGAIVLRTCHRVEVYGDAETITAARHRGGSGDPLVDEAAIRHVLRVAVGLESAILAEDQILHQMRVAVNAARRRGPLAPGLGHLADLALGQGRRARSWLPSHRRSLADLALDRAVGSGSPIDGRVLVVGTGRMGRLVVPAVAARGGTTRVVGRTGVPAADDVGVVVALAGPWDLDARAQDELVAAKSWLVDLSSPTAVADPVRRLLGRRLVTIDDLATDPRGLRPEVDSPIERRLTALVERGVEEYLTWSKSDGRRIARELAERAEAVREHELADLWRRLPGIDLTERSEIERMAQRLADRLLHDPLRRLGDDPDDSRVRAAQDLFGV
jgi:glutamyl-tRNA reductase